MTASSKKRPAKNTTREDHGKRNARAWLASIREMVAALDKANDDEDGERDAEKARQTIEESILSVQVRDGWRQPGTESEGPGEYAILLTTGGPAARIVGDLDRFNEPDEHPRIEFQDWGTPWTMLDMSMSEQREVAKFARCFYFGE